MSGAEPLKAGDDGGGCLYVSEPFDSKTVGYGGGQLQAWRQTTVDVLMAPTEPDAGAQMVKQAPGIGRWPGW